MSYRNLFVSLAIIELIILAGLLGLNQSHKDSFKNTAVSVEQITKTPQIALSVIDAPEDTTLTFAYGGDVMLGRYVGHRFEDNFKSLVENLSPNPFDGKDIAWLNLEGPLSDQHVEQPIQSDNLIFNFSKESVEVLKALKVTIVGLGNNHTHNKGSRGLVTTRNMLEQNNILWHGDPDAVSEKSVKRIEKNGRKVSMIAVHALIDTSGMVELIKKEDQAGYFVIVLPHWGNEYQSKHSSQQDLLAKTWIDAGADMIIGAHPHVVQDADIYKHKIIFYSLGNLIFDQTFSKATQQGLIVTGEITSDRLRIILVPIESKNLKPQLAAGTTKETILNTVCNSSNVCQGDVIDLPL